MDLGDVVVSEKAEKKAEEVWRGKRVVRGFRGMLFS